MHNLLWCLNTEKGYSVLKMLHSDMNSALGLVCSYPEWNVQENYGNKIEEFCHRKGIQFVKWDELKRNFLHYLREYNVTGIVAIGWQYFLPIELNKTLTDKIIVFHDGLLPKYRGFCPLATAILKGETEVGVSVIYASEEIDEGDIILQKKTMIDNSVYLHEAISILSKLYCECAQSLVDAINIGNIRAIKQDHSRASYCIWRNPDDNKINWNKPAESIYNLIRASGPPYFGAYTKIDGEIVRVWRATILDYDLNFEIRDPGKIWKLDEGKPIVICNPGLIKILSATYTDGRDVVPLNKLRLKLGD